MKQDLPQHVIDTLVDRADQITRLTAERDAVAALLAEGALAVADQRERAERAERELGDAKRQVREWTESWVKMHCHVLEARSKLSTTEAALEREQMSVERWRGWHQENAQVAVDAIERAETAEAALAEAEEKLSDRYVAAMEAAQRIGDLGYENQALRTRISLAIGRIERGESGAALTGLQAALTNAEMGDEQ